MISFSHSILTRLAMVDSSEAPAFMRRKQRYLHRQVMRHSGPTARRHSRSRQLTQSISGDNGVAAWRASSLSRRWACELRGWFVRSRGLGDAPYGRSANDLSTSIGSRSIRREGASACPGDGLSVCLQCFLSPSCFGFHNPTARFLPPTHQRKKINNSAGARN